MNDSLPMPDSKGLNQNGSKCRLPLCNNQIRHLERHLFNTHNLTYGEYLERIKKTDPVSAPTSLDSFVTKNSVQSESSFRVVTQSPGTKSLNTSQSDVIVLVPDTPEWEYNKEKKKQKTSRNEGTKPGKKRHSVKRNLYTSLVFESSDTREWLRFLAHDTNSYKVQSLLVFLKQHPNRSITDYFYTKLREDVYGQVSLSFLQHVHQKRVELLSYFRKLGCYSYEGGKRPNHCLACDKKGEKCDCMKITPSFFVFCRYRCPEK